MIRDRNVKIRSNNADFSSELSTRFCNAGDDRQEQISSSCMATFSDGLQNVDMLRASVEMKCQSMI